MIQFSKMEEFHLLYQFFMTKPTRAIRNFILIVAGVLVAAFIWANIAQMDDVVKASAFLRPAETISTIRPLSGGQIQIKNYVDNENIQKGDLLLQFDVSADIIELNNSNELMSRINSNIAVHSTLLTTIRLDKNAAPRQHEEAFIHSEQFILENRRYAIQVEEIKTRLENERNLPATLAVRERLVELEQSFERSSLQFALWRNSRIVETTQALHDLTQHKENLQRRIADLELNIRNATIYSPIYGRVNVVRKLNVGDNVVPGEEILNIIPEGKTGLIAELHIDPSRIARVSAGQKAVLSFPGLPPSKYGKIETEISVIPADFNAVKDSTPMFVVQAAVSEPWLVSRDGGRVYLRAGIGASGRIVIDRDTVFRMILKKLDFINENYEQKRLERSKK